MNITKVIIPAAGLGTRFLPITKSIPKEMLPLLNKPALQYIVEEGLASGINHFCMIVSKTKPSIKQYFSPDKQLESQLTRINKIDRIKELNTVIEQSEFSYILQPEMRGLGDAVLMGKECMNNEYFGVILPDDLLFNSTPGIEQLKKVAQEHNTSVIAVVEVPKEEISSYGCVKIKNTLSDDLIEIEDVVEKPKPEEAFSNLAIVGRYIFSPTIFDAIEAIAPHAKGEVQLTDAITHLVKNGHKVLAYKIKGTRFDLGRPHGWLEANNFVYQKK